MRCEGLQDDEGDGHLPDARDRRSASNSKPCYCRDVEQWHARSSRQVPEPRLDEVASPRTGPRSASIDLRLDEGAVRQLSCDELPFLQPSDHLEDEEGHAVGLVARSCRRASRRGDSLLNASTKELDHLAREETLDPATLQVLQAVEVRELVLGHARTRRDQQEDGASFRARALATSTTLRLSSLAKCRSSMTQTIGRSRASPRASGGTKTAWSASPSSVSAPSGGASCRTTAARARDELRCHRQVGSQRVLEVLPRRTGPITASDQPAHAAGRRVAAVEDVASSSAIDCTNASTKHASCRCPPRPRGRRSCRRRPSRAPTRR